MTNPAAASVRYVLIDANENRFYFIARNDRAAKGEARRILRRDGRRPHSTYYLGDAWQDMRPVQAWNLGGGYGCDTAALYCEGPVVG